MSKKRRNSQTDGAEKRMRIESEDFEETKLRIFELFEQENTIPFLARYRKEQIGGLNADELRNLHEEFQLKK